MMRRMRGTRRMNGMVKDFKIGQLWATPCRLVVEIIKINTQDTWGVVGNVINNIEKSSFYDYGEAENGLGWTWDFDGKFDPNPQRDNTDSDLIKLITEKENPEYFI